MNQMIIRKKKYEIDEEYFEIISLNSVKIVKNLFIFYTIIYEVFLLILKTRIIFPPFLIFDCFKILFLFQNFDCYRFSICNNAFFSLTPFRYFYKKKIIFLLNISKIQLFLPCLIKLCSKYPSFIRGLYLISNFNEG